MGPIAKDQHRSQQRPTPRPGITSRRAPVTPDLMEATVRHQQTRTMDRTRGTSVTSLLALVAVVAGIALTVLWLNPSPTEGDNGPATVAPGLADSSPDTALPALATANPVALTADATGNAAANALAAEVDPAELLADYPRTTVSGRVVLLDHGEFPDNMMIEASSVAPKPGLRRLSISMVRESEPASDFDAIGSTALRTRTRVAVGQDGRFEMAEFPLDHSVWLDVGHPHWYQATAKLYEAPASGGELVVELTRGATIRGQVVDSNGAPVADLNVSGGSTVDPYAILDGTSVLVTLGNVASDKDGRFVMSPVPTDNAVVLSTSAEFGLQPAIHEVPALSGGEVAEATMVVLLGGSIEGLVLDGDDQPVAGTQVQLQPTSFSMKDVGLMGRLNAGGRETTDEEGRFLFDSLSDGSYRLALFKSNYRPTPSEPVDVEAGQVVSEIVLRADRGLSVSGQVTGPDGEPLPGAEVTGFLPPSMFSMRAAADRESRTTETVDATGHFTLWGYDEGDVRVLAEADGFVGSSIDVSAGDSDLEISLLPKAAITGIAIDLSTGDPLTDYQLRLLPAQSGFDMSAIMELGDRLRNMPPPLDVSDDEGRFSMPDITPGVFDLVLLADGYAQTALREIVVDEKKGASGLIVMVPEEASVVGQVISGRTGLPLPGVTVTTGKTDAMSAWMQLISGPVPKTDTGNDGHFELGGMGAEPVTITFQDRDHRSVVLPDLALIPGDTHNVGLVTLPPGGTIHGTVFGADNQPVAGVTVMAADAMGKQMKRSTTNENGGYEVTGLDSGTYNVMRLDFTLSLDSDNPASMMKDIAFETVKLELDEVKLVDLGAKDESGCLLEGVVQSAAGPEADAMVVVVRENGPPGTEFSGTNDDGYYAIKGLDPGKYLIQVIPSGTMVGGGSQPSSPVFSSVVIGDQEKVRHDVDVPGGVLRGETRSVSGERLRGIRVLLERTDDGRPRSRFVERMGGRVGEAYSDAKGEFQFEHLPAGTFALQAGGTNLIGMGEAGWAVTRVEDIPVREGSGSFKVVVELAPGGAISGVVHDDDKPLSGVPVWARNDVTGRWMTVLSEVVTDAAGRYTINSLEPGQWSLAFGGDSWALTVIEGIRVREDVVAERDVELTKGVEVFAELGPFAGRQLSVRIEGPTGVVPTQLTSLTALMSGGSIPSQRQRLGRLPPGSYSVWLHENGEAVFEDTVRLDQRDTEVVVSLAGDD